MKMFLRNIHVNADQLHEVGTFHADIPELGKFPVLNVGRGTFIADLSILSGVDGIEREHYRHSIHIGNHCSIAGNLLMIIDQDHPISHVVGAGHGGILPVIDPDRARGEIILQNDVWIGYGVTIMNGVTIRNGACVAASSHVVKDIPPYAIVGGNPAKVIGQRFSDEEIADLLCIGWWNWSEQVLIERKEDFRLPVRAFIDKYLPSTRAIPRAEPQKPTYLFFGDFTEPYPVWEKVLRQYVKVYGNCPNTRLLLYLPEDEHTDENLSAFETVLTEIYGGKGDIVVQVGGFTSDEELIRLASHLITSRSVCTVRRCELADRMGVRVISAFDKPIFKGEIMDTAYFSVYPHLEDPR